MRTTGNVPTALGNNVPPPSIKIFDTKWQLGARALRIAWTMLCSPSQGFTYVDDASWTVNQRKRFETSPNLREDFLVKTDDEVRMAVFDKISILQDPVQGIIYIIIKIIKSNASASKL